jgi:hypothetical protein
MRKIIFKLAVTVLFGLQALAAAQTKTADVTSQIKTSIAIDSAILSPDKPAIITITIENTSGQELEISSTYSFDLMSKAAIGKQRDIVGDRYWSPVNVSDGKPTQLNIMDPEKLKQGVVVGRVPQVPLKFAKDETKTFKVDLTKTFWNDAMYSTWPEESLFKIVPKGSYVLTLELRRKGFHVGSNAIEVSVK